jgi:hypothetical protein
MRQFEEIRNSGLQFASKVASASFADTMFSNTRILSLDERGVSFRYKDYRRNGQARHGTMTLSADEFIRRFLLHVLPKGFHRIRHYPSKTAGFLRF